MLVLAGTLAFNCAAEDGEGYLVTETGNENPSFCAFNDVIGLLKDGDTVRLMGNVKSDRQLVIEGITVTIDLNGHTLTLNVKNGDLKAKGEGNGEAPALAVTAGKNPGRLLLEGAGRMDVNGPIGVYADGGSSATVTKAAGGMHGHGALAVDVGSTITVLGNATGTYAGARAEDGGVIYVEGNAYAGLGAYAGGMGAQAYGDGSKVTVLKDARGFFHGVGAEDNGTVVVKGNVEGKQVGVYAVDGATVEVGGSVNWSGVNDDFINFGVYVDRSANVYIGGDVNADSAVGHAVVFYPSYEGRETAVTIDGEIASKCGYLKVDGVNCLLDNAEIITTKRGYRTYTNEGRNTTVWLKDDSSVSAPTDNSLSNPDTGASLKH